jgi:hypothetical protein
MDKSRLGGIGCSRSFLEHTLLLGNRTVTRGIIEAMGCLASEMPLLGVMHKTPTLLYFRTLDDLPVRRVIMREGQKVKRLLSMIKRIE